MKNKTTIDGTISADGVEYNANLGGGIYNQRGEVTIDDAEIKNCTAKTSGGGLYHYHDNNKPATITNTTFSNNKAMGTADDDGGGAIYFKAANTLTLDNCTITDNSAAKYGGGVYYNPNADGKTMVLKNNTAITGNKLDVTTVANGGGVFVKDRSIVVIGDQAKEADTVTIYDNRTSDRAQSNLRIRLEEFTESGVNRHRNMNGSTADITLYSNLVREAETINGLIGVCNPGDPGTQFGLSNPNNHTGVENFISDDNTMNGKIDDASKEKIIWWRTPVCQITDLQGNILSYGDNQTQAVFYSLKDAVEQYNNLSDGFFSNEPVQIQMLVADYTLNEELPALNRKVTLTTAATSSRCTITRGENSEGSMFKVNPGIEMTIKKIILDGGSKRETTKTITSNGGLIYANSSAKIVLDENAIVQNSKVEGKYGGAIYLAGGAEMSMNRNATVKNCSAYDGGGIYAGSGAKLSLTDAVTIKNCSASRNGGAVYVYDYAKVTLGNTANDNPKIQNNNAENFGAGIYLYGSGSRLNMQGKPEFAKNVTTYIGAKNGGEAYDYYREDIYLSINSTAAASNIVVTGEITSGNGSVWVRAYHREHYLLNRQFAIIAEGLNVSDDTLHVFRDAVDDETAENRAGQYYTGVRGSDESYIYWGVLGVDISFKKIDSFGSALPGATFTLYKNKDCTGALDAGGTPVTAISADGTSTVNTAGDVLEKGQVLFERIASGVYYMKESESPNKDPDDNPMTYDTDRVYLVLVGTSALEKTNLDPEVENSLSDITVDAISNQATAFKEKYGDEFGNYAIFLLDSDTGKAMATPDIAKYGIMNIPTAQRKAILRKVEEGTYKPLPNAVFEILRYDRTKVSIKDINGDTVTTFTSGNSGVYFIDKLPFGTYYLHETKDASGQTVDLWFTLTVNDKGVGYENEDKKVINTISPKTTAPA